VSITVHLPDELAAPLAAAAAARGVGVEQVAAELVAEGLAGQDAPDTLEAFLGSGSSGRHEPLDIHQLRRETAARTTPSGI
jgi:plasmid stability protein